MDSVFFFITKRCHGGNFMNFLKLILAFSVFISGVNLLFAADGDCTEGEKASAKQYCQLMHNSNYTVQACAKWRTYSGSVQFGVECCPSGVTSSQPGCVDHANVTSFSGKSRFKNSNFGN